MKTEIIKRHHGFIITNRDIELAKFKWYWDQTMDTIFDVCYEYTKYIATPSKNGRKSLDNKFQYMKKHYYDDSEEDYPKILTKGFDRHICLDYLDEEHNGDCVKYPMTCMRCYVERLIGCNTMPDNSPYFPKDETSCEYQKEIEPDVSIDKM
jgi:hypothetical protein